MKKILLIIFLLLVGSKVNASTYYSEYSEYSEYLPDLIESNDLINVEKVKLYQLYKENITYEYLEDSIFEKTGNETEIETDWVNDISLVDQTKNVETCYNYQFALARQYSNMVFVNTSNRKIIIKYLKLYDMRTNSVILDMENINLNESDKFVIKLDEFVNLSLMKLEIDIAGNDNINNNIKTDIYVSKEIPISSNGDYITSIVGDTKKAYLAINDFSIYKIYDKPTFYASECTENLPSNIKEYEKLYRNTYKIYEYKIIDRIYTDKYSANNTDELYVDLQKSMNFYRYKQRDKVIISDNLIIDSKDKKLIDFIEYSSINLDDIKITSNVNYNKNGIYQINFILPFKTVSKDITVNIEANYINLINEQANYITDLNNSTSQSNYAVDKKNLEIKEVIIEEESKNKEITELLNTCYQDKKDLEKQKQNLNEEKNVKQQSIGYIYVLLLLIILLLTCRKKLFKKSI